MAGRTSGLTGFLLVDKPAGITSHDAVSRCRRLLGERRVGHAGTLDPDATGLLLIGVGRATRLLRFFSSLAKSYAGEVVLGTATSTLDAAGEVVARADMSAVPLEQVKAAAAALAGDSYQVPPMVSAVRVGGKRLYELAREGREVERKARPVTVHRIEIAPGSEPESYALDVTCSAGTYVRVLASDIGERLGGPAHLRGLRRYRIGSLGLEEAVALDEVGREALVGPVSTLRDYAMIEVDRDQESALTCGRPVDVQGMPRARRSPGSSPGTGAAQMAEGELFGAVSSRGDLLAMCKASGGTPLRASPVVVLG